MENAVVRGAGRHPAHIGERTLVGPFVHISGATIGSECMVATRSSVFNGARVADGVLIAIGAIVHVATVLPSGSVVPMQHIAVGDPARILPPERASEAHEAVEQVGFTAVAFGTDTKDLDFRQCMAWLCSTYTRSLRRHQPDT